MRKLLLLSLMLAFTGVAQAEDIAPEQATTIWKSDVELGFVQTGGNTQTKNLNTKGKVVAEADVFRTTLEATALSSSDNQGTTSEKYTTSLQEDWKMSEVDYLFGRLGFVSDRFGGYRQRLSETVGYGRDLIKNDDVHWKAEVGGGLRQTRLISTTRQNDTIARASTGITWKINEAATLIQDLSSEGGKDGFVTNSVTALQNKLNGHLSSKISYSVQNNSKVPVGTKKTDTELAVALVWSY